MKKLFTPLCLLALGAVLLAVWLDRDREWKTYQGAYYEAAAAMTEDPAKRRQIQETPLEIQQIQTRVDGRADRCVTCHMGVDNPNFSEQAQPFTTHPKQESFRKMLHHSLDEFGCTFCHDGQGLATTKDAAHGHVPHWDRPLLTGDWLDVGCGRCHKGTLGLAGAPTLSKGRRVARRVGCYNCHKMEGFEQEKQGEFGPDLQGAGLKLDEAWLKRWLKDPYAFQARTKMLNFYLTEEEAQALTTFLMAMKGGGTIQAESLQDVPEVARGRELFQQLRCFFCHKTEGFEKKDMAPDLTGFGMKNALDLDFGTVKDAAYTLRGWTRLKIRDPRGFETRETELAMPGNDLTGDEVDALSVLLLGFSGEGVSRAYRRREDFGDNDGKRLFERLHCVGCHNVSMEGLVGTNTENVAMDLSGIGNKVKVVWLFQWLKDPSSIYPDTKMPTVGSLTEEQALKLAEYVMRFRSDTEEDILVGGADGKRLDISMESILKGKKVYESMECYRCHRIGDRGGRIAPELSRIGEKVREDWLLRWLATPENYNLNMMDDRPVTLTEPEVAALSGYLLTLQQEEGIPPAIPPDALILHEDQEPELKSVEKGKNLFGEDGPVHYLFGKRVGKMGLGCYGCHELGGRGNDIGPDLSEEGGKVKRDWLQRWLKVPRRYMPDTRMGDFHLTDEEVNALTDFLMTRELKASGGPAGPRTEPPPSRGVI